MLTPDSHLGKFSTTARLFKLINDMPRDQQLILLKQLVGENLTTHLFKLVVEMTEDQQIILLEQMGDIPISDEPVRTVSLEEAETSMRENPRKPCLINAEYQIDDRDFHNYILDISIGGVFIETNERFPIGKNMILKFFLPNTPQPFALNAKIAWSGPRGFGVKFDALPSGQEEMLKSFVDQKD